MNSNNKSTNQTANLIGQIKFRDFLKVQTKYGFSHRGGVQYPFNNIKHAVRLISTVNILSSIENENIVYSESIFSN